MAMRRPAGRFPITSVLLVIAAAFWAPGCDRPAPSETPAGEPVEAAVVAAEPPSQPSGDPVLEFASLVHDFGEMPETETRTAGLEFVNGGTGTLVIREVKTTCGCTAATLTKTRYEPGERGSITVVFDPSAPGVQRQYVSVISNASEDPVKLQITADVQPFITVEPRMIQLGVIRYGRAHRATVDVSSPASEFVVESVTASNPQAIARLLPVEESPPGKRTVEVIIQPSASWGGFHSWLKITANGRLTPDAPPVRHTSQIRVQGQIFGVLRAEPDAFRFGAAPGESFERVVQLRHPDGVPFTLVSAEVTSSNMPGTRVRVEQESPNAYTLILTSDGAPTPMQGRGAVTVKTDVPGEESLDIPIIGVVRPPSRGPGR